MNLKMDLLRNMLSLAQSAASCFLKNVPNDGNIYQVVAGVNEDSDDDDRGSGQLGRVGGRM